MEQSIQHNIGLCLIIAVLFIAFVAQTLRLIKADRTIRNLRALLRAEQKSADAHQREKWEARAAVVAPKTPEQIESETIAHLRAYIEMVTAENSELADSNMELVHQLRLATTKDDQAKARFNAMLPTAPRVITAGGAI